MDENNCIFCKIVKKEKTADIVYQDNQATVFWDQHPAASIHLLVIPNQHVESVNKVNEEIEPLLGHLFTIAKKMAKEQGIAESGYRLVVNTGPNAGQSVFHLHVHLLGGQNMPSSIQ